MLMRFVIAALLTGSSILAGTASAQTGSADVTLEMPLNLTRIHDSIPDVKIICKIQSQAFNRRPSPGGAGWLHSGDSERTRIAESIFAVTQNSVAQNAEVVFPLTDADFRDNASGKQATYECRLFARSISGGWREFLAAHHGDPVHSMTPVPVPVTGAFVW